jgi:glycosyltransferase involved in cell wall biosynthesis
MRITFLNAVGSIGGAEMSLLSLMAGIRQAAPEIRMHLIAGEDGPLLERVRRLGIEAQVVGLGQLRTIGDSELSSPGAANFVKKLATTSRAILAAPRIVAYCRHLRAAIAQARPDVVHSNSMKMHLMGAVSTPRAISVIWQIHDYISSRPLMKMLLKLTVKRCNTLVGVSQSVCADLQTSLKCRTARMSCVYNSVDPDAFSSEGVRADLDRLAGLEPAPSGTIKVGLVGTFARWKGHEVFLSALAAVPRHIPVRGYIVGAPVYSTEGSQYSVDELKTLCSDLRIANRVGFTGYCDRPAEVMRALDIVVHASVAPEPFGMVLVEAMCAGTAVISTARGGAAEICLNAVNCLTCRPGDAASLADRIATLAEDRTLRAKLAASARGRGANFRPERAAAEMIRVYRHAIEIPEAQVLTDRAATTLAVRDAMPERKA